MSQPEAVILSALETLNRGDLDAFYALLSEDFVYTTPLYSVQGRDATRAADAPMFAQLSHHWREADRVLTSGDKVAVWLRFGGTVARNGRTFEVEVCDIFTVDGEQLTALEIYGDFSGMMAALQG